MTSNIEPFSNDSVPIGEALVWIVTRDPEVVIAYRLRAGAAFEQLFGEEIVHALSSVRGMFGQSVFEHDPKTALERAIATKRIQVYGRRPGASVRDEKPLPPALWGGRGGLSLHAGPSGFYAGAGTGGFPAFKDLGVCRTSLFRHFPALAVRTRKTNQDFRRKEESAKAFIIVRAHDDPGVKVTQDALADHLNSQNLPLSKRDRQKLWKSLSDDPAIAPHLAKQGRPLGPKKTPRPKTPRD